MSGALAVFERFQRGGLAYLQGLRGQEVETHLQDFKLLENGRAPMSKGDKKTYAEALSGFANSDGGVVVWGVDCRKGAQGEDVVQDLRPIANLTRFVGELNDLQAQLVSPGIAAQHFAIEDPSTADAGYAVSYIPRGEGAPHMAVGSGHKFMYRAGSSFLPMPQWMVADRFGRRPQPILKLGWFPREKESNNNRVHAVWVHLIVENIGGATAKYPGFSLKASNSFAPTDLETADVPRSIKIERTRERVDGQANNEVAIHPKRSVDIGILKLPVRDSGQVEVPYELFCDGFYCDENLVVEYLEVKRRAGI